MNQKNTLRAGGARAAGIHLEEAVGDERGGREPGHEHPRVSGPARAERRAAGAGAELEEVGEGGGGEGPRLRGGRRRGHRERAALRAATMCLLLAGDGAAGGVVEAATGAQRHRRARDLAL